MSIFSRSSNAAQTAAPPAPEAAQAAQTEQAADPKKVPFAPPRAAAPGVVPPPAAPVYSMRPADGDANGSVADSARLAREAQLRGKTRVVAQRARAIASPAQAVVRRTSQQPASPPQARHQFDPLRAAQTGLLDLAWSWQQAGAPIRAIHTYVELLCLYPDSAAADAAVADLVELSDKLATQGQFHTALRIYDHLEQWATMEHLE